ncbi:MAG: hypothetical protein P8Z49_06640, partial [Acidobacteriota bacterium]
MYHIPVWHPLFVHFPVAFILSAGACSLGWLVLGYKFWRKATLLFLILGFLGGIAAYYTGDNMHEAFRDKPAVRQLVEEHEDMAAATMWFTGAALFVLGGLTLLSLKDKNDPDKKPWLDTIWAKLAVAALSLTAASLLV